MDYGKYIIVRFNSGVEVAILFSNLIDHSRFANIYSKKAIASAGFFTVDYCENRTIVEAFGKSETLNLESRPDEDTDLIKRLLQDGR